jgi:hypothetical protein
VDDAAGFDAEHYLEPSGNDAMTRNRLAPNGVAICWRVVFQPFEEAVSESLDVHN